MSQPTQEDNLTPQALDYSEFEPPTFEAWREATVASLKGRPFEKLITQTYEGISLSPLYRREDIADLMYRYTYPGHVPRVRGNQAAGYQVEPWTIVQGIGYGLPETANSAIRADVIPGQTGIRLWLDSDTLAGRNPGDQAGRNGVSLATVDDLKKLFEGVDLSETPVMMTTGWAGPILLSLLTAALGEAATAALSGYLGEDLLAFRTVAARDDFADGAVFDDLAELTRWAGQHTPQLSTVVLRSDLYQDAGATAVQELAFVLSAGVAYIRALLARELDLQAITKRMVMQVAVGPDFFMEVAKLRALRLLWGQIIAAFGGESDIQAIPIHARTALWNKAQYDPHVNLLRTTTESIAAVVGGVSSLEVAPFDAAVRPSDAFARRLARNQQLVLRDEAHFGQVIDPAGGSYYVEWLTDQIAQRAWVLFQDMEGRGGYLKATEFIREQIESVAARRSRDVQTRKTSFIGTNIYPIASEKRLPDETNFEAIASARQASVSQEDVTITDSTLPSLIAAARQGATLEQLMRARHPEADLSLLIPSSPPQFRVAADYESLREEAAAYRARSGHAPRIFVANMGPIAGYMPRLDFTRGFFEVGGFEVLAVDWFEDVDSAVQAAKESGAAAVVICGRDDVYAEVVEPLAASLKSEREDSIVILAGYPQDDIERYQNAGVDTFIHLRANCYEVNVWLQEQMGVRV